jgi:mono/diheme cytochrome c family protein
MNNFGIVLVGVCVVLLAASPVFSQGAKKASGDAGAGKDVFEARCWDCHNPDSKEKKVGPGLQGVKDGKLPSGKESTHDNILENINKGKGDMPPFKDLLTDQEKEDVIAYVMTL